MGTLFIVGLIAVSSLLGAWLGVRVMRLPPQRLPRAGQALIEFVGLWTVCLLVNVALGVAAVLVIRTIASAFVSAYFVNDLSLVVVSALQACLLQAWMSGPHR
jgi:uncharacterized membrane protein YfcA